MKPLGKLKVKESTEKREVAMVKVSVTDLPDANGTRSAAAMVKLTPVTWPPSAPDAAPTETRSVLVATEMPLALPALGAPIVTPDTVTVCAPEATTAVVVRTTEVTPIWPIDA